MNLNELIKKYEDLINELDDIIFLITLRHERVSKYYKEKNIYEAILSDLKQLKEKIMYPDDCYVDNDNGCYIRIEEIIGVDTDE
ncbi:MAG TPA: hypothetical protein GX708_05480 [Gallicola sp.]|nr:hypothetical protein [Gallicola sp.]